MSSFIDMIVLFLAFSLLLWELFCEVHHWRLHHKFFGYKKFGIEYDESSWVSTKKYIKGCFNVVFKRDK